jgi:hypothetical protein
MPLLCSLAAFDGPVTIGMALKSEFAEMLKKQFMAHRGLPRPNHEKRALPGEAF